MIRRRTRNRISIRAGLLDFQAEMQIQLLEHVVQDVDDPVNRAQVYVLSTNLPAKDLRGRCKVIWINDNLNDWSRSVDGRHTVTNVAFVAQFTTKDKLKFISRSFDGNYNAWKKTPGVGFKRLTVSEQSDIKNR